MDYRGTLAVLIGIVLLGGTVGASASLAEEAEKSDIKARRAKDQKTQAPEKYRPPEEDDDDSGLSRFGWYRTHSKQKSTESTKAAAPKSAESKKVAASPAPEPKRTDGKTAVRDSKPTKYQPSEEDEDDSGLYRFGWYRAKYRAERLEGSQTAEETCFQGAEEDEDDSGLYRFSWFRVRNR